MTISDLPAPFVVADAILKLSTVKSNEDAIERVESRRALIHVSDRLNNTAKVIN